MKGINSLASFERMARCWRVLPPPVLLMLLLLAFPHLISTQWTTKLRRSCVADSASALCSCGCSREGDARVRTQLARVVSAFRDSEAHASQLGLNLTAAVERYRADVNVSSQLAARSVGRLSLDYDALDERLTALGAALRNGTQMASITANSELLAVKNEMVVNMSSLADAIKSELCSMNEKMNVSADQLANVFIITGHQTTAISQLNQTQQIIDATCSQQVSALGDQLNSTKLDFERLREEFERLREDNERLISDVRNMSALLRECPNGWQRNGSWCYLLVSSWVASWNDSRERCKMMSADLVTVPTAAVNAFLTAYLINYSEGSYSVWLGATDVEQEGVWRWITGEIFFSGHQRRSYANFAAGEPANNHPIGRIPENCLTTSRMGTWNDMPCRHQTPFICRMYRP